MIASVIVNYFGHQLVRSAAESLLRDRPDIEVIVVDNSVDAEESQRLREVLDDRVKIITNASNTGFGAACNVGIASTQAEFIMLLNPDTQVIAGCMDKLQAALEQTPRLAAVSPAQLWESSGRFRLPPAWLPTGIEMWCIEQAWRSHKVAARMSNAYRNLALRICSPTAPRWFTSGPCRAVPCCCADPRRCRPAVRSTRRSLCTTRIRICAGA